MVDEQAMTEAAHAWADHEGCGNRTSRHEKCFKLVECACLREVRFIVHAYVSALNDAEVARQQHSITHNI